MRDPDALYELAADVVEVPRGLSMVAALTGFADSGSAVSQFAAHLLENLDHHLIASFDTDELLDYRARRPTFTFEHDHLTEYAPPAIELFLMRDELEQPFLFLTGFEPDFQWERFTTAILRMIERFDIADSTWVHAIPMPVPHTRPIGVTVSGTRTELIESMSVWKPSTQVPGNILHLLEFRLTELAHPVAGFVLLVPHYLADTEYPAAAVAALECVSAATGLLFPTDRLREENRDFIARIDSQVEGNQELAKLVGSLEERHDSYMEENPLPSPLTDEFGELPSADEIAAELQSFLAAHSGDDEPTAP